MRLTEQTIDALAADYVIGTMSGRARERFERAMMESEQVRKAVWFWERQLNQMAIKLEPISPEKKVWQAVAARLQFTHADPTIVALPTTKFNVWQPLTGLATAAALILAVLFYTSDVTTELEPAMYSQIALFQDDQQSPLWLLEISDTAIVVRATDKLAPRDANDFQLWLVASDGRAPISLGLLPQDGRLELPKDALFDQIQIAALAVSLEPLGGSPTGSPTQVLYTAELISL